MTAFWCLLACMHGRTRQYDRTHSWQEGSAHKTGDWGPFCGLLEVGWMLILHNSSCPAATTSMRLTYRDGKLRTVCVCNPSLHVQVPARCR
jgi:hypothetical protein